MGAALATRCPDEGEILSLLQGSLDGSEGASVREHVDVCVVCQELVACLLAGSARSKDHARAAHVGAEPSLEGRSIGRFRIRTFIGAGAMGVVYLADDTTLNRTVAVKVHRRRDAIASDRLLREARAIARLSHPNVIVVHEVGTFEDKVFMAMEFVDGSSLTSWLAAERRSLDAILEVFLQAGRGLAVAHGAGLVHRDFKPDNVLVGRDGRVRVLDFGLAREELLASMDRDLSADHDHDHGASRRGPELESLTRTGTVVGTPAYMAPEQYAGEAASARSDQFSFCVALFEALYGQRPFTGTSFAMLERAVTRGQIDLPRAPPRRVPKALLGAIVRGLSVRPEDRFASMEELLSRLLPRPRRSGSLFAAVAAVAVVVGASALVAASRRAPVEAAGAGTAAEVVDTEASRAPSSASAPSVVGVTKNAASEVRAAATPTSTITTTSAGAPTVSVTRTAGERRAMRPLVVTAQARQSASSAPTSSGASAVSERPSGPSKDLFDSVH